MYNTQDNIVALATTPGKSALNVIRASGPGVLACLKKITLKNFVPKPNFCSLQKIYEPGSLSLLDQALVVYFKNPKSYTGQDLIELSVHGGVVVAKKIISSLEGLGCRQALPGEFSYRAFVGGKIDLVQAEAVASIINTNSDLGAYFSAKNLVGDFSLKIEEFKKNILKTITHMEHELDFDENEIEFKTTMEYADELKKIIKKTALLVNASFLGTEKTKDTSVCIVGKTNVGKSSLFNVLCGHEKAIVTNVAGTTRDFVEESFIIGGLTFNLIDTAGLRSGGGKIEKIGIKKTYAAIKKADIVFFVDNKNPVVELQKQKLNLTNKDVFLIQNKIDRHKKCSNPNVYHISCKSGLGTKKLSTSLLTLIKKKENSFLKRNQFVISRRIKDSFERSQKHLKTAAKQLEEGVDLVVVISSLYLALGVFSDMLSPINKEDIINKIFGDFCVGK
tara:strand:+ start:6782 stop:8125 length:1344 start_codon:yes stop_codon:yes gene_type:complete